jgi:hypothetical protein
MLRKTNIVYSDSKPEILSALATYVTLENSFNATMLLIAPLEIAMIGPDNLCFSPLNLGFHELD